MGLFGELSTNVWALLIFSAIALLVYYLIPLKTRVGFLLCVSFLFYGLCDWKMMLLLALSILLTWVCASRAAKRRSRKWLFSGCAVLIGVLAFFKYNGFFTDAINGFLGNFGLEDRSNVLLLAMPLGISYYVFKSISYMVDVYKGECEAEKSIWPYALYVSFFAEILSGPISRYSEFKRGLDSSMRYTSENMERGFYLIIRGLFMKGVIANRLAGYVGAVFSSPADYTGIALWLGAFFYAVQLYCDFAGYSSIAVGITQLFGLHYKENFRRPYFSSNIVEFWNRWHISLSTWLRDYIYIPLGGSRCSKIRTKLNVIAVFLVSGVWHGSGLNFVVWGLYHGLLNICTPRKMKPPAGFKKLFLTFVNFCAVTFGWIFFGTPTIKIAFSYIKQMFLGLSFSMADIQKALLPFTGDNTCIAFFLTAMFFILMFALREFYEEKKNLKETDVPSLLWQTCLLTSVVLYGNFAASGFIYANF